MFGALLILAATPALSQTGTADTLTPPPTDVSPLTPLSMGFALGRFDSLSHEEITPRHSLSFDQLLEYIPGYFVSRAGPIGADALVSRHSIGRGRAAVYLGSILINDPQNDIAPIALMPMSSVGKLLFEGSTRYHPSQSNIEGVIEIVEPRPLDDRPLTFIELSRGDRNVGQRRFRLSSARGPIGFDYGFDELLNDGYNFDTREIVQGPNVGKSTARTQAFSLRGRLPGNASYLFMFRDFRSTFQGDLDNFFNERLRNGHTTLVRGTFGRSELDVFDRVWDVSAPDSSTENHTTGVSLSVPVSLGQDKYISMGGVYEDIFWRQDIGGASERGKLSKASIGVRGHLRLARGSGVRFSVDATHYVEKKTGWGGTFHLSQKLTSYSQLALEVERRFRMPNLGELFLPTHTASGTSTLVTGNEFLKSEGSIEGTARLLTSGKGIEHELRATVMRVRDPIFPTPYSDGTTDFVRPENGESENLFVLENRFQSRGEIWGWNTELAGGVEFTGSERRRYFSMVPEWYANVSLTIGKAFFKNSSDLYFRAEYQFSDERQSVDGTTLDRFDVLNLKLDFRLIDAQLYIMWLNVFDERYETVSNYLMMPRTFVYGVEWTLFD